MNRFDLGCSPEPERVHVPRAESETADYALLQMLIYKQREEAEKRAIEEYRKHEYPKDLLRDRVYGIIACAASATIDYQPPQRQVVSEPFSWSENLSRTSSRLATDILFHRMVSMIVHEVTEEVGRYLVSTGDDGELERQRCARIAASFFTTDGSEFGRGADSAARSIHKSILDGHAKLKLNECNKCHAKVPVPDMSKVIRSTEDAMRERCARIAEGPIFGLEHGTPEGIEIARSIRGKA